MVGGLTLSSLPHEPTTPLPHTMVLCASLAAHACAVVSVEHAMLVNPGPPCHWDGLACLS